jgi:hypothetical protein
MIKDINDIIYSYLDDIKLLNKYGKCLVEIKEKRKYIICKKGTITSSRNMNNRYIDCFNISNILHITRFYKWTNERESILIDNNHNQRFIKHENICGN